MTKHPYLLGAFFVGVCIINGFICFFDFYGFNFGVMIKIKKSSWDEVYAEWKKASPAQAEPNRDIWSILPDNVQWCVAEIEANDDSAMNIIGSSDWKALFGSYAMHSVAEQVKHREEDDKYRHTSRILSIVDCALQGIEFPRIIFVAEKLSGPYVAIDGNHRMVGLYLASQMEGKEVFLGISPQLSKAFKWYYWSVK